jgi:hypothetical protein
MTATDRVRKHRAKLRTEQCSRLEVWIAGWIVEGIRQLAKSKGREPWAEVQDVLERHLIAEGAMVSAPPANLQNHPT